MKRRRKKQKNQTMISLSVICYFGPKVTFGTTV